MGIITGLEFLSIIVLLFVIIYAIEDNRQAQIEREKIFQKWIFDSLYSLDHKVLLPKEHDRPLSNKKMKVYKPEEDPMSEFKESGL